MADITETQINPSTEIADFENNARDAGAVVTFTGRAREMTSNGALKLLRLEHFPGVTEKSINKIENRARERWSIETVKVLHRVGDVRPGETIVLVCVGARHRRDAFEAADFIMDYLKTDAYFWKKEITENSEVWIEPRDADYQDAARWFEGDGHK